MLSLIGAMPAAPTSVPGVLLPLPPLSVSLRPDARRCLVCLISPQRVWFGISAKGSRGKAPSKSSNAISCTQNQLSRKSWTISHSNRLPSAAMICAAALQTSKCAAEQTQTVQRPSSTITIAPNQGDTKLQEKSPKLDDGGTGFPPFYFGGGGGGGGGGGHSSSGGFFLFAFLVFLNYLKELDEERQKRKQLNLSS